MNTIERNETLKLLHGKYIIGLDYADIMTILGDHIDDDEMDRIVYNNEEPSDTALQSFADHVQFFTLSGELSEEELLAFAQSLPKDAPQGFVFLFSEYTLGEISDCMEQFEKALPDVELANTGVEEGHDDPAKKRISVWCRK